MTLLPFEDLPAKLSTADLFDTWWPVFWAKWPHKVDKQEAMREFRRALNIAAPQEIIVGENRYIAAKPEWQAWMGPAKFLRRRRWEDEYDAPRPKPSRYTHEQLEIIARHFKADWYQRGAIKPDVLAQCVEAGLLTADEVEAKS